MNRSYTVLLIDDDEGDQLLLKKIFSELEENITLQIVNNGQIALELLNNLIEENKPLPDLVLVDLNMPIMDGKSFLKVVKNTTSLKYIPIVILSTSDYSKDVKDSYNLGTNSYVVKPLNYNNLRESIQIMMYYWLTVNSSYGG